MRSVTILAVLLLAAIFVAGFYADSIKSQFVKSIGEESGCIIEGQLCTCYSKECVCEGRIYPISACTNPL
jgi:hypothetical protein